jgi:hypothetical protein
MTEFLSALQTFGIVLGIWTMVSVLTALVLVPWIRARARASFALSQRLRSEAWVGALHPANERTIATR